MTSSLLVQTFPALPGAPTPRLLLDVRSGDCAVVNPPADRCCPILNCLIETIRGNRLSLEWILFSVADPQGFLGGALLKEQFVAARSATGVWSQREQHNCEGLGQPDRLLAEGERIQLGTSFGRIRHLTDEARVYTGYLFESVACLGAPLEQLRPLEPDPLECWPGSRMALT